MSDDMFRQRLYHAYASTHAGLGGETLPAFKRDIAPHLPSDKLSTVLDLGCGQGQLVRHLVDHGFVNSRGVDISPEQVELAHRAGIDSVILGDYRDALSGSPLDAITATDFFEHLTRDEVLEAMDYIYEALQPGGVLILRVPNSVSPFGGNYRYGDMTHETSFTARSLAQLGAAAGFAQVEIHACPPPIHGTKSLARRLLWSVASGAMKAALAAETGKLKGAFVTQNIVAVMRKAALPNHSSGTTT